MTIDSSIVGTYDTSNPGKWVEACRKHCRNSIANTGTGAWLCIALAMIESLDRRLTDAEAENERLKSKVEYEIEISKAQVKSIIRLEDQYAKLDGLSAAQDKTIQALEADAKRWEGLRKAVTHGDAETSAAFIEAITVAFTTAKSPDAAIDDLMTREPLTDA